MSDVLKDNYQYIQLVKQKQQCKQYVNKMAIAFFLIKNDHIIQIYTIICICIKHSSYYFYEVTFFKKK